MKGAQKLKPSPKRGPIKLWPTPNGRSKKQQHSPKIYRPSSPPPIVNDRSLITITTMSIIYTLIKNNTSYHLCRKRIGQGPSQHRPRTLCSDTSYGFQVQHICGSSTLRVLTSKMIHTYVKNKIPLLHLDIQMNLLSLKKCMLSNYYHIILWGNEQKSNI